MADVAGKEDTEYLLLQKGSLFEKCSIIWAMEYIASVLQ